MENAIGGAEDVDATVAETTRGASVVASKCSSFTSGDKSASASSSP